MDFAENAVNTTLPPLRDFFFVCLKSVFGDLQSFLGSFWEVFGRFLGDFWERNRSVTDEEEKLQGQMRETNAIKMYRRMSYI